MPGNKKRGKHAKPDDRRLKRMRLSSSHSLPCVLVDAGRSDALHLESSSMIVRAGREFLTGEVHSCTSLFVVSTGDDEVMLGTNDDAGGSDATALAVAAQHVVSLLKCQQDGRDIKGLPLAVECQCLFDRQIRVRERLAPQGDIQYWAGALIHPPDNDIFLKKLAFLVSELLRERA